MWRVSDVFFAAQRAVLAPLSPLFDPTTAQLRPAAVKALRRLFRLFDGDEDGLLSEVELTRYQSACHGRALSSGAITAVQLLLSKQNQPDLYRTLPSSLSPSTSPSSRAPSSSLAAPASPLSPSDSIGITFAGFCILHVLMLHSSQRADVVWSVLTAFGYDTRTLTLTDAYVSSLLPAVTKDSTAELSQVAVDFLTRTFHRFDDDRDGLLSFTRPAGSVSPSNVEEAFAAAPDSPFAATAVRFVSSSKGAVDLHGWLSLWSLLALTHPLDTVRYLAYLSYPTPPFSYSTLPPLQLAVRVQPTPAQERKSNVFTRRTVTCLVLGAAGTGKSALCSAFIGRPFSAAGDSAASTPRTGLTTPSAAPSQLSPLPAPAAATPSSLPLQPAKSAMSPAVLPTSSSINQPSSVTLPPSSSAPAVPFSLATAKAVCNLLPSTAPKTVSRRGSVLASSSASSSSPASAFASLPPPGDRFLRVSAPPLSRSYCPLLPLRSSYLRVLLCPVCARVPSPVAS